MKTCSSTRKSVVATFAGVFLIGSVGQISAQTKIFASSDTFITQDEAFGGTTSNHGSSVGLRSVKLFGYDAQPLFSFDLSSLAGLTVTGTVELNVHLNSAVGSPQRFISLHEIVVPWDAATVTYANFGTVSGLQLDHESNADVGPSLWITDVVGAGLGYKTWTIPGGVVQGWIDDPSSFRGLLLFKAGNNPGEDLTFTALENSQNMPAYLNITVIPEPASAAWVLGGSVLVLASQSRRNLRRLVRVN